MSVHSVMFCWSGCAVCMKWLEWGVSGQECLRSDLVNKLIKFFNLLPDLCLPGAHVKRVFCPNGKIPDHNLMV